MDDLAKAVLLKVCMQDETQSTAFSRFLQEYRPWTELTQEALSEVAGMGRRSIRGLERGKTFLTAHDSA